MTWLTESIIVAHIILKMDFPKSMQYLSALGYKVHEELIIKNEPRQVKTCLFHMPTTKVQFSLCIHNSSFYIQTFKPLASLCS